MRVAILLSASLSFLASCQPQGPAAPTGPAASAPIKLVDGLGPVHHPVSTADAIAQKYFDQGLAYIYGFNHDAAVRSFDEALAHDPNLAMAHWGRAVALGPNINLPEIDAAAAKSAYEASRKALELSASATESERAYIDAVSKRYSADPKADLRALAVIYANAMKQVARKFPTDLDAATIYAESMMNLRPWRLWTKDGKPEEGTDEIVATLEWVLARNPNHLGANHYYIHAVEASLQPERAMPSAQRLPKLSPASGHLVHMPAHIYIRTGDYPSAIAANAAAARVDEHFISCCGPRGFYPTIYYSHNLHFLAVSAAMIGRSKEASDAAQKLAANIDPAVDAIPPVEPFASVPLLIAVRQAQWADILKAPQPRESRLFSRAIYHFARGMAHASTGSAGPALDERNKFLDLAAKAPNLPFGNNPSKQLLDIATHLLAGKIANARGDKATARAEFQSAIDAEDALVYEEPPSWPWPIRETLGAHLLLNNDPAAAEKVFRDDLARSPNNPRSLFGLSEALKAQGRNVEADPFRKQFDQAWSSADMKPRLEEF